MQEKTKTFIEAHKAEIVATAIVTAAVGIAVVAHNAAKFGADRAIRILGEMPMEVIITKDFFDEAIKRGVGK